MFQFQHFFYTKYPNVNVNPIKIETKKLKLANFGVVGNYD